MDWTVSDLTAVGTASAPITWTSSAAGPAAGDWGSLSMEYGASVDLEYVVVEYGGGGGAAGALTCTSGTFSLLNSTVRYSDTLGVYATAFCAPTASGNTFTGNVDGSSNSNYF